MVEILAPCGGKESFYSAVNNRADAVYLGLDNFSARKNADNFTLENIAFYVAYAHTFDVKVYVCVNTLIKDCEISEFINTVHHAYLSGVDAFIVQDLFLGKRLKKTFPDIVLHLSTQAGVNNVYGAEIAKSFGFSRVVLARETEIGQIKEITKIIETEVFAHGAMCTSFSGHCYLSSFIGGNSGNRGLCRQPCRKKYAYGFSKCENYALSMSDLCLADKVDELKRAGVKSLKIEGRMRSAEYVGATVRLFKKALSGEDYKEELSFAKRSFNRGNYSKGFTFGQDKNLLSTGVQGNLGEFVGKVGKFKDGKISLKKSYSVGSGFKILRNGVEVGSAICQSGGNELMYSGNVLPSDDVYVTKDTSLNFLTGERRLKDVFVSVTLKAGEKPVLECGDVRVCGEVVLDKAKTAPVTKSVLESVLSKTDVYPFRPIVDYFSGGDAFIVKSELNKLRNLLYEKLFYGRERKNDSDLSKFLSPVIPPERGTRIAVITTYPIEKNYPEITEIIFEPKEYNQKSIDAFFNSDCNPQAEKYLYVPAFMSDGEILKIKDICCKFNGFYVEGAYGFLLAEELGKTVFSGIEVNVFNAFDVEEIKKLGVGKIALSKELSIKELSSFDGYVLSLGSIKVMSLVYCPNGRNCAECKVADLDSLTDYSKRVFPVRRYKTGECRFELFNESILVSPYEFEKMIFDFSGMNKSDGEALLDDYFSIGLKGISKKYRHTSGNLIKGIK